MIDSKAWRQPSGPLGMVSVSDGANTLVAVFDPRMLVPRPGTGGMLTDAALWASSRWVSFDSSSAETGQIHFDERESTIAGLEQRFRALKATLGATITDMADLFDVARPSIYAWLKGQEPRAEKIARLAELEVSAKKIEPFGIPRIDRLLKRPLRSGGSLFSLIKNGAPLDGALQELAQVARAEQEQRTMTKGMKDRMTGREAADHYSRGVYQRDA